MSTRTSSPRSTTAAHTSSPCVPGRSLSRTSTSQSCTPSRSSAFPWEPVPHPKRMTPTSTLPYGVWTLPDHELVRKVRATYDPDIRGMRSTEPWGSVLAAYPYPWFLHGTLFGVLLLAGAAGSVGRGRPALPSWAFAMFLLVAPVAAIDFDHRYVLPAIPPACVAAALAVHRIPRPRYRAAAEKRTTVPV